MPSAQRQPDGNADNIRYVAGLIYQETSAGIKQRSKRGAHPMRSRPFTVKTIVRVAPATFSDGGVQDMSTAVGQFSYLVKAR
jgi:hypothetical protein